MDKKIIEQVKQLGKCLKKNAQKIVTAESCTGGGLAYSITEVPGSSAWFDRGFVTYSNKAKVEILQVKQQTLDDYGAVSEQVAKEMAEGALLNSDADLSVAVTGIAGPDGGTDQKPVGTVFIAWTEKEGSIGCSNYFFSGNRDEVRRQTILYALGLCYKALS